MASRHDERTRDERGARFRRDDAGADGRGDDELDDLLDEDPDEGREERGRRRGRGARTLIEGIAAGILDPDGPLRRGGEVIGGVTRGTKEELVRIVSAEVRNFLDKMDAVDLLQQVVHGLTVDVNIQVKFSREEGGRTAAKVTRSDARVGSAEDDAAGGSDE